MRKITAVTLTGARQEAYHLCKQMMERQTIDKQDMAWLIVDDGPEPIPFVDLLYQPKIPCMYHRPDVLWEPGKNTMVANMKQAMQILKEYPSEWIAFVEDDDWYHPEYFETMLNFLEAHPEVLCLGEAHAKYYNLQTRHHKVMSNNEHASLCQTIIHHTYLPLIEALLEKDSPFFDIPFWDEARKLGHAHLFPESKYAVGIKGLPGRMGIGVGHRPHGHWSRDLSGDVLRSWIGKDFEAYKKYLGVAQ